jgi:hypothetical protein
LSTPFSRAHDCLSQAIALTEAALQFAHQECADRHILVVNELRINGLIDAVAWRARITEALITLKAIREAPGMGAAAGGSLPESYRPVDPECGGGDVVAGSASSNGTHPLFNAETAAGVQLCIPGIHCRDRATSPGVAT